MSDISKAAFYVSYYETAKKIPSDKERLEFYDAILGYMFEGKTPANISPIVDLAFTAIHPIIDADKKRKKGGAPEGNTNAKKQPENNLKQLVDLENSNNVNVNVKDNDKDKENDNVNIDPHTFIFLPIKDLLINNCAAYGFKVDKNALNSLLPKLEKISVTHDIEGVIKERLEYIFTKYKDKTDDEKKALFYKSFDWDSIPLKEETPKIKKVTDPRAPKVCTFCGSKLTKWAGVPNGYQCITCIGNGHKNTSWELIGDEYKCNRAS